MNKQKLQSFPLEKAPINQNQNSQVNLIPYLCIKREIVNQVSAVESLAVGLAHRHLVFLSLEYFNLVCILKTTSLKITFSRDKNCTSDTVDSDCLIIVSVLEYYIGNPELF